MQDNISLFQTQTRGSLLARNDIIPVRRLILRGNRNYLRALRAAEMDAWENSRLYPARSRQGSLAESTRPGPAWLMERQTVPAPTTTDSDPISVTIGQ
jgi:hypothetical protein